MGVDDVRLVGVERNWSGLCCCIGPDDVMDGSYDSVLVVNDNMINTY